MSAINPVLVQGIEARFTKNPENSSHPNLRMGLISVSFEMRNTPLEIEALIKKNCPEDMDDRVLAFAAASAINSKTPENFAKIFELMKILIGRNANINGVAEHRNTALSAFITSAVLSSFYPSQQKTLPLYNRGICLLLLHGGMAPQNLVEKARPKEINQIAAAIAQLFEEQKTLILLLLDTTQDSILTKCIPWDIRKGVLLPEVLKFKSLLPSTDKGSIF